MPWTRADSHSGQQREWCLDALDRASELLTGPKQYAWRQWTDEWRHAENDEEDYFGHARRRPAR